MAQPLNESNVERLLEELVTLFKKETSRSSSSAIPRNRSAQRQYSEDISELNETLEKILASMFERKKSLIEDQRKQETSLKELGDKLGEDFKEVKESIIKALEDQSSTAFDNAIEKAKSLEKNTELVNALEELKKLSEQLGNLNSNIIKASDKVRNIKAEAESDTSRFMDALGLKLGAQGFDNSPWYLMFKELQDPNGIPLLSTYFSTLGDTIGKFLEPLNLFLNAMKMMKTATVDLVLQLDSATVNFMKTTGMIGNYVSKIENAWQNTRYFNVTLQEVSTAFASYIDQFAGFSRLSDSAQESFVEMGATASRLGVSLQASAGIFSFFNDTLKRGTEGAKAGLSNILGVSKAVGESLNKITSAFVQALPVIAKWGNQTESVFRSIAATAKAFRVEISEVLQIAQGFDTFETAASNVGRLNAILGGPFLNTMQLLQSNEADVVKSLHQAFIMSGKNWWAMNRHERQAIATAAGISDMNLATKLFTGTLAEANGLMARQSIAQKEMQERSQRAADIGERFKSILQSIAILLEPLVDGLHTVVGWLQKMAETLGVATIPVLFATLGIVKGLAGAFFGLGSKLVSLPGMFFNLFKAAKPAEKALDGIHAAGAKMAGGGFFSRLASGFMTMGTAGVVSAKGIGLLALAIVALGGAIGGAYLLFRSLQGIADGIYDLFTDSPLEEWQDEMEDMAEVIDKTKPDFSMKWNAMGFNAEKMMELMKGISPGNLTAFTDFYEKIATIGDKVTNSLATDYLNALATFNGSVFSVTPSTTLNPNNITNINIEKEKKDEEYKTKLYNLIDKIASSLTLNETTTNKKELKVTLEIDGDEFARKVIDIVDYGLYK